MKLRSAYLYLSTAKLDQLIEQESGFFKNLSAKIDFKVPFVSGGLSAQNASKNIASLERIEKQLRRKYSVPSYDEIPPGSSPVFVYFKGRAIRAIQNKEFWLAVDHSHAGLLLAGSASFVMGEIWRMAVRSHPAVIQWELSSGLSKSPSRNRAIRRFPLPFPISGGHCCGTRCDPTPPCRVWKVSRYSQRPREQQGISLM